MRRREDDRMKKWKTLEGKLGERTRVMESGERRMRIERKCKMKVGEKEMDRRNEKENTIQAKERK